MPEVTPCDAAWNAAQNRLQGFRAADPAQRGQDNGQQEHPPGHKVA